MILRQALYAVKPIIFSLINLRKVHISIKQRSWKGDIKMVVNEKGSIKIGQNANFREHLQLRAVHGGNIKIGNNFFSNTNVSITSLSKISIGNNVRIANNVVIVDHNHDFKRNNSDFTSSPIVIDDNVWVGANVVILQGCHIGKNSVIAAGSVVTHDVCAKTVVAGIPARCIESF